MTSPVGSAAAVPKSPEPMNGQPGRPTVANESPTVPRRGLELCHPGGKLQEAYWDLKYHPFQDLLLSVSAASQNGVLLWNCEKLNPKEGENAGSVIGRFGFADGSEGNQDEMIPTACTWMYTQ